MEVGPSIRTMEKAISHGPTSWSMVLTGPNLAQIQSHSLTELPRFTPHIYQYFVLETSDQFKV